MAKLSIVAGATSQSLTLFIQNNSVTTGAGLTGLVYNTSGLTCYYTFTGTNAGSVAVSLVTLSTVSSAFSSGGFKEIDSTNMPGCYRFDIPNAAIGASKGRSVVVYLQGATNMAPCVLEIELTGWDNQDAIHGGMSAIPNTACTTNASLLTSGTGTDQLSVTSGRIDLGKALGTAVTLDANNVLNVSTKYFAGTAVSLDANGWPKVDVVDWLGTVVATPATAGIPDVNVKNINNVATTSVTTVSAYQGTTQLPTYDSNNFLKVDLVDIAGSAVSASTAQLGVNVVNIAGTASAGTAGYVAPDWSAIHAPTTTVDLSGTTISTAQTIGSVSGAVGSVTGNVGGSVASVTGAVGSVTGAVGSVSGNVGGNVAGNVVGTVGFVVNAPFKINTANGFSVFLVQSSDNKSPYTGGSVTAVRSIAGGSQVAVSGSITQVGSTNEYYFSGAAADFNGTTISYVFSATGANTAYITINTQP